MMETTTVLTSPPNPVVRPNSRRQIHVDAFHSPFSYMHDFRSHQTTPAASADNNPFSKSPASPVIASPGSLPLSFSAVDEQEEESFHHHHHHHHHHNNNKSSGRRSNSHVSGGGSPTSLSQLNLTSPVINIRRRAPSSSSSSLHLDDLHIGESSLGGKQAYHRRHHSRSESCAKSDCEKPHLKQSSDSSSTSVAATGGSEESIPMFPTAIDDINPAAAADDGEGGEECSHHHHRQSSTSTVSIKCDRSDIDPNDLNESEFEDDYLTGEIESSIPMAPADSQMLVPLLDRPKEMSHILSFPANASWVEKTQRSLGDETWTHKCLPLWTETERSKLPDVEWLRRSEELLVRKSCGGARDVRLWSEFCDIVGWDVYESFLEADGSPYHHHHHHHNNNHHHKHGSGSGGGGGGGGSGSNNEGASASPPMNAIKEEEETTR